MKLAASWKVTAQWWSIGISLTSNGLFSCLMTQPPGISDMLGVTELPAEWRYNTLSVAYFSSYDIYIFFGARVGGGLWCNTTSIVFESEGYNCNADMLLFPLEMQRKMFTFVSNAEMQHYLHI